MCADVSNPLFTWLLPITILRNSNHNCKMPVLESARGTISSSLQAALIKTTLIIKQTPTNYTQFEATISEIRWQQVWCRNLVLDDNHVNGSALHGYQECLGNLDLAWHCCPLECCRTILCQHLFRQQVSSYAYSKPASYMPSIALLVANKTHSEVAARIKRHLCPSLDICLCFDECASNLFVAT